MRVLWVYIGSILLLLLSTTARADLSRVAVLEFRGVGIQSDILLQLSDEARGGMREGLPVRRFDVTSRESISQILEDMGKTIADCSTECEVSLGRDVGADYVLSGSILKVEQTFLLTMKLHDTHSGSLLSQKRVEASSLLKLLSQTNSTARTIAVEKIASKQSAETGKKVTVTFTSFPADNVTVLVSGQPICSNASTCKESVLSGSHEVTFLRKEYFPFTQNYDLSEGLEVHAELKAQFSTLQVHTEPPNLGVTLNGSKIKAEQKLKKDPGVYKIMIKDSCYQTEGVEITLKPNDKEKVDLVPQYRKSGIDVRVFDGEKNALAAKVFVDDKYVGNSPFRGEVPKCAQNLRIEHGDKKVEKSLSLKEHQLSLLNVVVP